jgi:hypothetical protein
VWNKYEVDDFNEATTELSFTFDSTNDDGIDGDYTAGLTDAIPDEVVLYVSVADDLWTKKDTWGKYDENTGTVGAPGVGVPAGGPRGARVLIKNEVIIPSNYIVSFATEIDNGGVLKVNDTYGHRLGNTSGTGTLYLERGDMPAGDYVDFLSSAGGTIEYGGTTDYDILSSMPEVNNIIVSGSGERRLPNIEVQLLGNLTIDGPDLINEQAEKLNIKKDLNFNSGTYVSKSTSDCTISMNGSSQQNINGLGSFTGTNSFYNFEIDNEAGVTLNTAIEIDGKLMLTSGVINSTAANTITITNSSEDCVLGGGDDSYVAGPLYKTMLNSGSFVFPVGDNERMGKIEVNTDASSGGTWQVQYFKHSAGDDGMDLTKKDSDIGSVSGIEYWNVKDASGSGNANLTMYWDAACGVTPDEDFRIVKWTDASPDDQWEKVAVGTKSGTSGDGNADLASDMVFNEFTGGNYITFGGAITTSVFWEGDVTGNETDWFEDGNWSTGTVPSSSKKVVIENGNSNYPVINSSTEVTIDSLEIENGASLTLSPGAKVIVNGNIKDENSVPGITVKNTVANPASFIYRGTDPASANIEWVYPDHHYWFVGHAVENVQYSDYSGPTSGDLKLYMYTGSAWVLTDGNYIFDKPLRGMHLKIRVHH